MKKVLFTVAVVLVAAALISACGGGGSASSQGGTPATGGTGVGEATPATAGGSGAGASGGTAGDPKAGETLFTSATIGTNPGCKTCHTIDGSKLVGPSLQGIATRAATRVPGDSAEQYIRTSVTDPNAYIVEGFTAGVMPSFKTVLSDTQLNDVVAYLMTLK